MIYFTVVFTLILWVSFIALTRIVDTEKDKWETLNILQKVAVAAFVIVDVVHNYTAGTILYLEMAHPDRKTLTARMKELIHKRSDKKKIDKYWRKPLALFMCKYMVEPWDFNHCGLEDK